MTLTNHFLAGSVIAMSVGSPLLGLPLALASHFALDVLPHFGYKGNNGYGEALRHKMSYVVSGVDAVLLIGLILFFSINGYWLGLAGGVIAMLPDALGVYNYVAFEKKGKTPAKWVETVHIKFHRRIQWGERPWGVVFEVLACAGLGYVLIGVLNLK